MILIRVRNHLLETFRSNFFVMAAQKAGHIRPWVVRWAAGWGAEGGLLLRLCSAAFVWMAQTWRASAGTQWLESVGIFPNLFGSDLPGLSFLTALLERPGECRIQVWRRESLVFWNGDLCQYTFTFTFICTGNILCSFFSSPASQIYNGNLSSFCLQLHLEVLSICRCTHGFRMFVLEY